MLKKNHPKIVAWAWFWVPWEDLSEVLEAREASWSILEASWAVFGRKRWPTWLQLGSQNGSNIDRKSIPRCLPMLSSFFDRFLIDCYSQLRLPEPSKSLFFLRKNNVFSKNRLSKLASIFDAMLVPTWLHFASQIHQNPLKIRPQEASNI